MIDYKSLEEHIKNYFDASLDIDRCTYIIAINKDKAALESLKSHFLNLETFVLQGKARQVSFKFKEEEKLSAIYKEGNKKLQQGGKEYEKILDKGILGSYLEQTFTEKKNLIVLLEADFLDMPVSDRWSYFPRDLTNIDKICKDNNLLLLFLSTDDDRTSLGCCGGADLTNIFSAQIYVEPLFNKK